MVIFVEKDLNLCALVHKNSLRNRCCDDFVLRFLWLFDEIFDVVDSEFHRYSEINSITFFVMLIGGRKNRRKMITSSKIDAKMMSKRIPVHRSVEIPIVFFCKI